MDPSLNLHRILGVSALLLLAGGVASAGTNRIAALSATQLVEIERLLTSADRVEITLRSGEARIGRIESVTDSHVAFSTQAPGRRARWELETIATQDLRHLRLWHTRRSTSAARLGRKIGFSLGLVAAGPVISAASRSGSGIGAWTALVGFPAAGLIIGERFARRTHETFVPVLPTPLGSDSVTRP